MSNTSNLTPEQSDGIATRANFQQSLESIGEKPLLPWREQNGVIYITVTSDGTTGEKWIARLEQKGFRVSPYAKSLLCSQDFQPTTGVTYEIAILKGVLFADDDRSSRNIRAEAERRQLIKPSAEIACLIREKFTDQEIEAMGLWWIVVMHESTKDSGAGLDLFSVDRDDGGRWLNAYCDDPDNSWSRDDGFVFLLSQASPQA